MRVLKFGGSSLADADRFLRAADIIANNAQQEEVAVDSGGAIALQQGSSSARAPHSRLVQRVRAS